MKKFALVWIIVALVISFVTTFLQIEPAYTFIRIFEDSEGRYRLFIVIGITFILLVLPLLIIMIINILIQNGKNKMPDDFNGKTGIIIKREKELTYAALMYAVHINTEQKAKLGMGKSVFIELVPGTYSVQILLGKKIHSPEISVQVEQGEILAYQTKTDLNKSLTTLNAKGEMLFLIKIPFSNN